MKGFVPKKIYKILTKFSPIASNDVLVEFKGKYLLLKRTGDPARGLWYTPGSRIYKNEKLVDAVHRVAKEELGINKIKIEKFLAVSEFFCKPGKFGQKDIYYISFAYLVKPVGDFKIKMDYQHSDFAFYKNPPKNSHIYIRKLFSLAKKKNLCITQVGSYTLS
ncbi:MAG: NUDIX domain-containing protein [Candidatus Pacebacteria bacterium]|nr:NUDIX domain-containing protein [Candidatus Paceibacterota bacterium]